MTRETHRSRRPSSIQRLLTKSTHSILCPASLEWSYHRSACTHGQRRDVDRRRRRAPPLRRSQRLSHVGQGRTTPSCRPDHERSVSDNATSVTASAWRRPVRTRGRVSPVPVGWSSKTQGGCGLPAGRRTACTSPSAPCSTIPIWKQTPTRREAPQNGSIGIDSTEDQASSVPSHHYGRPSSATNRRRAGTRRTRRAPIRHDLERRIDISGRSWSEARRRAHAASMQTLLMSGGENTSAHANGGRPSIIGRS